jgi:hypothetical protein
VVIVCGLIDPYCPGYASDTFNWRLSEPPPHGKRCPWFGGSTTSLELRQLLAQKEQILRTTEEYRMSTTRLSRRATMRRQGLRALAVGVTTSALAALAVVTAAPASATPSGCEIWLSGSRGQTANGRCTAGTGSYYTRAVCNDGTVAYGPIVTIGRVSSAICYGSAVRSAVVWEA